MTNCLSPYCECPLLEEIATSSSTVLLVLFILLLFSIIIYGAFWPGKR